MLPTMNRICSGFADFLLLGLEGFELAASGEEAEAASLAVVAGAGMEARNAAASSGVGTRRPPGGLATPGAWKAVGASSFGSGGIETAPLAGVPGAVMRRPSSGGSNAAAAIAFSLVSRSASVSERCCSRSASVGFSIGFSIDDTGAAGPA